MIASLITSLIPIRQRVLQGWILVGLLWLTGCTALPVADTATQSLAADKLASAWPDSLPSQVNLSKVPFFAQQDHQCGPAALASLLRYSGVRISPEALTPQVYTPGLQGSLQLDLIGAARRAGRIPYRIAPTAAALGLELAAGHPVLVLQDVGHLTPVWHFAVVVGYNRETREVILHSGDQARLRLSMERFDRSWVAGQRWGLVILPPEQIPASANAPDYLQQVAAMESIRPGVAESAYQASLKRWPDTLTALMGLGNLAYAQHHYHRAAHYFERATKAHSDSGDAFNNLAESRLQLGQMQLAREASAQAVALGGSHLAAYQRTQQAIMRQDKAGAL